MWETNLRATNNLYSSTKCFILEKGQVGWKVAVHIFFMNEVILFGWVDRVTKFFLFSWIDEGRWRSNLLTKLWFIIRNINS
jgi:hypothetical protein